MIGVFDLNSYLFTAAPKLSTLGFLRQRGDVVLTTVAPPSRECARFVFHISTALSP